MPGFLDKKAAHRMRAFAVANSNQRVRLSSASLMLLPHEERGGCGINNNLHHSGGGRSKAVRAGINAMRYGDEEIVRLAIIKGHCSSS